MSAVPSEFANDPKFLSFVEEQVQKQRFQVEFNYSIDLRYFILFCTPVLFRGYPSFPCKFMQLTIFYKGTIGVTRMKEICYSAS